MTSYPSLPIVSMPVLILGILVSTRSRLLVSGDQSVATLALSQSDRGLAVSDDVASSELLHTGLRNGSAHAAANERRQLGKMPCSSSSPSMPLNWNEPYATQMSWLSSSPLAATATARMSGRRGPIRRTHARAHARNHARNRAVMYAH